MRIAFAAAAGLLAVWPACAKVPDFTGMWVLEPSLNKKVDPNEVHLTPVVKAQTDITSDKIAHGNWVPDNHVRCDPAGMPQMMAAPFGIQIMQSKDRVMVMAEVSNLPRTIQLDPPKAPDIAPSWNGWSVGSWEGDVLKVETTDFNDQYTFLLNALPIIPRHETLKVHERFSLEKGGQVLVDDMILEDPYTFTAPYHITYRYRRLEPSATLMEYVCEIDLPLLTQLEADKAAAAK